MRVESSLSYQRIRKLGISRQPSGGVGVMVISLQIAASEISQLPLKMDTMNRFCSLHERSEDVR